MAEGIEQLVLVEHPVISRDMTILRDVSTPMAEFRRAMNRISTMLAFEALKNLPLRSFPVQTPIKSTTGFEIDQDVIIVPILRAGLGISDALREFLPGAKIGHLGMYRDETTHQPVDYYSSIPPGIEDAMVLVVDPMLATGGSADDALSFLKNAGAQHLRFISLIAAPEGINKINQLHPDVQIITAAVDECLNDDAFIVPGLGDAGDRYFGTE